ncbi:MAG TPA: hypothetical protein VKQ11_12845 [Candidatus Sulfotelmatobacter sp.]|nr:hypothetical protein [Candidatus Sulfotelmatobacter sp.]
MNQSLAGTRLRCVAGASIIAAGTNTSIAGAKNVTGTIETTIVIEAPWRELQDLVPASGLAVDGGVQFQMFQASRKVLQKQRPPE